MIHLRHQFVRHLRLDVDRFPCLIQRRSDVEDMEDHRHVDEEGSLRKVSPRTYSTVECESTYTIFMHLIYSPSAIAKRKSTGIRNIRVQLSIAQETLRHEAVRFGVRFRIMQARPNRSQLALCKFEAIRRADHEFGSRIVPAGMKYPSHSMSSVVLCGIDNGSTGSQRMLSFTMALM